jgi:hypothetical protein
MVDEGTQTPTLSKPSTSFQRQKRSKTPIKQQNRGNNKRKEKKHQQESPVHNNIPDSHAPSNPGKGLEMEEDTVMEMDEQDLADIDLDKLEEALNKKDLKTIPKINSGKFTRSFSTPQWGLPLDSAST